MKLKNNQSGAADIAMILAAVVILVIGFVSWRVWDTAQNKDNPSQTNEVVTNKNSESNNTSNSQAGYITIDEWGVRFPTSKVGKYSYNIPTSGQGSRPELTHGGPSDLQFISVNVSGFTRDENNCIEGNGEVIGLASIYRHKEQNPTIKYTTTHQLNPTAQVKIDDWYYSTYGLAGAGNCFEGKTVSADFVKLQDDFLENFKKLAEY